jgi:hypothetical protein
MSMNYADDSFNGLVRRVNYLEKRLSIIESLDPLGLAHAGLTGLSADDHTQYLNNARHDVTARHGTASVDHGQIAGLGDDDHAQYHNDARGDVRYYTKTQLATSFGGGTVHWNNITGTPTLVDVTGTPTAGRLTSWADANTAQDSGIVGTAVVQRTGSPTAGRLAKWTNAGTVEQSVLAEGSVAQMAATLTVDRLVKATNGSAIQTTGVVIYEAGEPSTIRTGRYSSLTSYGLVNLYTHPGTTAVGTITGRLSFGTALAVNPDDFQAVVLSSGTVAMRSGTPTAGNFARWASTAALEDTGVSALTIMAYSGTPTAGRLARWVAPGTVEDAGISPANLYARSGTPTAGRLAQFVNAGTIGDSSLAKTGAGVVTIDSAGSYTLTAALSGNVVVTNPSVTVTAGTLAVIHSSGTLLPSTAIRFNGIDCVGIGGTADNAWRLRVIDNVDAAGGLLVQNQSSSSSAASLVRVLNDAGAIMSLAMDSSTYSGTIFGLPRAGQARVFADSNATGLTIGAQGNVPLTLATNLTERVRITGAGNVGFGVTAPQGKIHGHDGTGGFLHRSFSSQTFASAVVVIPNGTGDVVRGLTTLFVVRTSGGAVEGAFVYINNGASSNIFDDGSNILRLRVNADGSVDLTRTAGSLSYTVTLWLIWL